MNKLVDVSKPFCGMTNDIVAMISAIFRFLKYVVCTLKFYSTLNFRVTYWKSLLVFNVSLSVLKGYFLLIKSSVTNRWLFGFCVSDVICFELNSNTRCRRRPQSHKSQVLHPG